MSKIEFKPINYIKADLGIQNGGPAHKFFTSECAKEMDRYLPWRTGTLARTVIKDGQVDEINVEVDKIIYNTEYAIYPYFGDGLNFRKDVHPEAGPHWDERMWTVKKYEIVKRVQKYIDRGAK